MEDDWELATWRDSWYSSIHISWFIFTSKKLFIFGISTLTSCFWRYKYLFWDFIGPWELSHKVQHSIIPVFYRTPCSFHKRSAFSLKLFMIQRSALIIPHQMSKSKNTCESVFSPRSKVGSSQLRGNFRIMSISW